MLQIDIAKSVFHVHHIDENTGQTVSKAIKRAGFLHYFSNRSPCLIGMEACGGAQHWARELTKLGHQVRLLSSRFVKAFNIGNKSDAADARAIWLAVQQPGKAVAVKTEAQQAVLAMHRMREQLVKMRTMQINALRGLMTEYGEVIGRSRAVLEREMPGVLHRLAERLPAMLIDTLRDRWNEVARMDEQIARIEQWLRIWLKQDKDCSAVAEIPGVGLLTATAAVATMADPKAFKSGREFAAFMGLFARQHGSGGRVAVKSALAVLWNSCSLWRVICGNASQCAPMERIRTHWRPVNTVHLNPDRIDNPGVTPQRCNGREKPPDIYLLMR